MKKKQLTKKIVSYYELSGEIVKAITEFIYAFIQKRGVNGCFKIDSDTEEMMDRVRILVEVDRHTGDMGFESIESISISPSGPIQLETNSNTASLKEIYVCELIDLYEYLLYIDDESNWNDVEIVDGTLKLKDTEN